MTLFSTFYIFYLISHHSSSLFFFPFSKFCILNFYTDNLYMKNVYKRLCQYVLNTKKLV